jgi:inner membrane protein
MPFAKTTTVSMSGDWPSPSFDGGFLPDHRDVGARQFAAAWTVPFVARGLSDQGPASAIPLSELGKRDVGVTFARTNNPYENVQRALKYGVMFVGLVFLTFFVFEALSGQRLHPAQYILIGLAQMVFYLLLLSISEYLGFDVGFVIAATATVALIGFYAGWAFKSASYRARALAIFTILYALIYCLMRLEDFALLAGSLATFVGLATAMYLTRNLEWYGSGQSAAGFHLPTSAPPETQ